ncbi:MAG: MFS transporter [Liquorilactobacillus nagelii]|uniref:MFS transporter n=1 Tax=Liquorilactobacillus nagelii TaxID=82688 RepID=UPI0039EA9B16
MKKISRAWIMAAIFIATFMTSVEVTIVTTALPEIISALHGLRFQSWIMSSYLLTTAISTLIYGKLADTYGRKILFQLGVVLFTLGSFLSSISINIFWLIAARALQGCGAGAVIPLTFTIIADVYAFKDRARIMAFTNTAWGLSALIGPLLGGFLVENLSWHWVFFVNVPLGILVWLIMHFRYIEAPTPHSQMKIDSWGCWWLASGLTALLIGIQLLQQIPLVGWLLIIASLGLLVVFLLHEQRSSHPLLPLSIFKNKTFKIQIITATILSGILIGYQIYFPIWLQSLYHIGATEAGLVVTSSSVCWLAASFAIGRLLSNFAPRKIALVVITIQATAYLGLLLAGSHFPYWLFYFVAAISGGGMGIVITMNIMLSQQLVSTRLIASASAVVTLGRSLGQTLFTGIYGSIFNLVLAFHLSKSLQKSINQVITGKSAGLTSKDLSLVKSALLSGLHSVFFLVIGLFILVLLCNWFDPNRKIIS